MPYCEASLFDCCWYVVIAKRSCIHLILDLSRSLLDTHFRGIGWMHCTHWMYWIQVFGPVGHVGCIVHIGCVVHNIACG
jgi:hypothetical protein